MNKIADYAIGALSAFGRDGVDSDMGENFAENYLTEEEWRESLPVTFAMAEAIGEHRDSFLAWYRSVDPSALTHG